MEVWWSIYLCSQECLPMSNLQFESITGAQVKETLIFAYFYPHIDIWGNSSKYRPVERKF